MKIHRQILRGGVIGNTPTFGVGDFQVRALAPQQFSTNTKAHSSPMFATVHKDPWFTGIFKLKLDNMLNNHQEKIDYVIEGDLGADKTILFVHGLGTSKNGGENLFIDISNQFKDNFRIVRFDFSGYGKSEGKQEDVTIAKHAADLEMVLDMIKRDFRGDIYIIAHSLGSFVVSLLSPGGIKKTIFTGIPNSRTEIIINFIQDRIQQKGGKLDIDAISEYPRTGGQQQRIGSLFWNELNKFDPLVNVEEYSEKSDLLIIHPLQDEIVGDESIKEYGEISNLEYLEINGSHNYTKKEDRAVLVNKIADFLG